MASGYSSAKKVSGHLRRDVIAIVWAAMAVFIALALATYYPTDPSFNSTGSSLIARNACGFVGSFLSDLLYQGFGVGAWLFVFGCGRSSYRVFRDEVNGTAVHRLAWGAALLMTATALLALHLPSLRIYQGQIAAGGFFGAMVVRGLVAVLNSTGVAVLLWTTAVVLGVFYSERTIQDWMNSGRDLTARLVAFWNRPGATRSRAAVKARSAVVAAKLADDDDEDLAAEDEASASVRAKKKIVEPLEAKAKKLLQRFKAEPDGQSQAALASDDVDDGDGASEPVDETNEISPPALLKRRPVRMKAKINRQVENWKLPELSVLDDPPATRVRIDKREIEEKANIIVEKLSKFDVGGEIVAAKPGPAVTLFEFRPNADVQLTQVTSRADDLALALSAESLRIIAPIPGRDVVGIETSNAHRESVYLKDILADAKFWKDEMVLPLCLGREVDGTPRVVDLRSMPHMMVAGQTGSGKSVFVVSSIVGLVFRHSPKTLRLVLIDPKQVDLTLFNNVPHLLMPPICEARKAVTALRWGVKEMEKRNRSFNRFKVRKLEEFNEAVQKLSKEQIEEHAQINTDYEVQNRKNEQYYFTPQPFIVYVIEEFGDLMMVDKQQVEEGVVRLTQMARAAGIHLIIAMQTPRKEVVTGRIKTNIPGRVSFKVPGFLDSKIILDEKGAERLLGRGDMLFLAPGVSKPQRHHAPWLTNEEIERVVKHWSDQGEPQFDELAMRALDGGGADPDAGFGGGAGSASFDDDSGGDEMYDQILAWVSGQKTVSASLIQRKFGLGYPRASRMIDQFERVGVCGPSNGSKPRQVLIQPMPEP